MQKLFLVVFAILVAGIVSAQADHAGRNLDRVPPPASQIERFVDQHGCEFVRTRINGMTIWVQSVVDVSRRCTERAVSRPGLQLALEG